MRIAPMAALGPPRIGRRETRVCPQGDLAWWRCHASMRRLNHGSSVAVRKIMLNAVDVALRWNLARRRSDTGVAKVEPLGS